MFGPWYLQSTQVFGFRAKHEARAARCFDRCNWNTNEGEHGHRPSNDPNQPPFAGLTGGFPVQRPKPIVGKPGAHATARSLDFLIVFRNNIEQRCPSAVARPAARCHPSDPCPYNDKGLPKDPMLGVDRPIPLSP